MDFRDHNASIRSLTTAEFRCAPPRSQVRALVDGYADPRTISLVAEYAVERGLIVEYLGPGEAVTSWVSMTRATVADLILSRAH